MAKTNHLGRRYGRLVVTSEAPKQETGRPRWVCNCDCGNTHIAIGYLLTAGKIKSCGCLNRDSVSERNKKLKTRHAKSSTPIYKTWRGMLSRCTNPKVPQYPDYGARGIYVCDRWANDFCAFYEDMGDKPSPSHSLDRIDNDGPYSPENCRWATPEQQARNKRTTIFVEMDGSKISLREACEISGEKYHTAKWRLSVGKPWDGGVNATHR